MAGSPSTNSSSSRCDANGVKQHGEAGHNHMLRDSWIVSSHTCITADQEALTDAA